MIFFKKNNKLLYLPIVIISVFFINNASTNEIIFQKNNIVITNTDLKNYQNLYQDFYKQEISKSSAVKNLYVTYKIVDKQIQINPNFIINSERLIIEDVIKFKDKYSRYILEYFLRYHLLRKDYVNSYITGNNFEELNSILKIKIDFSADKECKSNKISLAFEELNLTDKYNIITNLSNKEILMENNKYACLNTANIEDIDNALNNILAKNGYEEFLKYVFKTIK